MSHFRTAATSKCCISVLRERLGRKLFILEDTKQRRGKESRFQTPTNTSLTCWFRAWIPVWEELSPAQPWLQARWCTSVALWLCRCQQPHCQHTRPVLGQGATFCKDLSLIRHPWFTLLTALLSLLGVWVESKCHLTQYDTISSSNLKVEVNSVKDCGFHCI